MGIVEWIGVIILKCNLTPSLDAADMDCGEAAATIESRRSNACHALEDGDGGEVATIECVNINTVVRPIVIIW